MFKIIVVNEGGGISISISDSIKKYERNWKKRIIPKLYYFYKKNPLMKNILVLLSCIISLTGFSQDWEQLWSPEGDTLKITTLKELNNKLCMTTSHRGRFYCSEDTGKSWVQYLDLYGTTHSSVYFDSTYMVGAEFGIHTSKDLVNWNYYNDWGMKYNEDFMVVNDTSLFGGAAQLLNRTIMDSNWSVPSTKPFGSTLAYTSDETEHIYAASRAEGVYKYFITSDSWEKISNDSMMGTWFSDITYSFGHLYVNGRYGSPVFHSVDEGKTWETFPYYTANFTNQNGKLIFPINSKVLVSEDGGENWTSYHYFGSGIPYDSKVMIYKDYMFAYSYGKGLYRIKISDLLQENFNLSIGENNQLKVQVVNNINGSIMVKSQYITKGIVELFSLEGKLLSQGKFDQLAIIPTERYPNGLYVVKVSCDKKVFVKTVMIKSR